MTQNYLLNHVKVINARDLNKLKMKKHFIQLNKNVIIPIKMEIVGLWWVLKVMESLV